MGRHSSNDTEDTRDTRRRALVSLILGVSSVPLSMIVVGVLLAIPAIVCGHLSLAEQKETGEDSMRSVAIIGLAFGYVAMFVVAPLMMLALMSIGGSNGT